MCAGRATHQPTSNRGENIACRNKSLIRGLSKTKHCRLFQKQKPLSAPGREWGTALRAGNSSTGSTKSESNLSVGFPVLKELASSGFACFLLCYGGRGGNERKAI